MCVPDRWPKIGEHNKDPTLPTNITAPIDLPADSPCTIFSTWCGITMINNGIHKNAHPNQYAPIEKWLNHDSCLSAHGCLWWWYSAWFIDITVHRQSQFRNVLIIDDTWWLFYCSKMTFVLLMENQNHPTRCHYQYHRLYHDRSVCVDL